MITAKNDWFWIDDTSVRIITARLLYPIDSNTVMLDKGEFHSQRNVIADILKQKGPFRLRRVFYRSWVTVVVPGEK